jgi:hypothetical protein
MEDALAFTPAKQCFETVSMMRALAPDVLSWLKGQLSLPKGSLRNVALSRRDLLANLLLEAKETKTSLLAKSAYTHCTA